MHMVWHDRWPRICTWPPNVNKVLRQDCRAQAAAKHRQFSSRVSSVISVIKAFALFVSSLASIVRSKFVFLVLDQKNAGNASKKVDTARDVIGRWVLLLPRLQRQRHLPVLRLPLLSPGKHILCNNGLLFVAPSMTRRRAFFM
jgi:hypothetical protein